MSFAEDLAELKVQKATCAVGRLLETLSQDDKNSLESVLADRSIASSKIVYILSKYGHDMSGKTVDRHRNKGTDKNRCSCP